VTGHDPLCLYIGDGPCRLCFRLETARAEARADERERLRREVEKMQDHAGVDFDGPWSALQEVLILIEGGSSRE